MAFHKKRTNTPCPYFWVVILFRTFGSLFLSHFPALLLEPVWCLCIFWCLGGLCLTRPTAFSASVRRSWNFLGTATSSCSSGNGSRSNMPTTCGREDPKISRNPPSWQKWVFPKIGVPQNGWWKEWKTLLKLDDLGENPLFSETSISTFLEHLKNWSEVATPMRNILVKSYDEFQKIAAKQKLPIKKTPSKTAFFCCIYHQIKRCTWAKQPWSWSSKAQHFVLKGSIPSGRAAP